jgi:hypothetical protein
MIQASNPISTTPMVAVATPRIRLLLSAERTAFIVSAVR